MARKQSPTLTEAELPIMDILWEKGSAVVTDVVAGLASLPEHITQFSPRSAFWSAKVTSAYQRRPRVRLSSCSGTRRSQP